MVKARASSGGELKEVVSAVKGLPRHRVKDFQFPKSGFFRKLDRLIAELDDISEFIHLETAGRSYILRIRHR